MPRRHRKPQIKMSDAARWRVRTEQGKAIMEEVERERRRKQLHYRNAQQTNSMERG